MKLSQALLPFLISTFLTQASAEVIASSPDHFTLKIEAEAARPPEAVWEKLIEPSRWWSADHTYSGNADNLSLTLSPGGQWREDWEGHGVEHGRVLFFEEHEGLRLDAPFGPLQAMAVTSVWSITLTPLDGGSRTKVTFDVVCNGSAASRLDEIAPAVDFVKTEAIRSLVAAE